MNYGFKSAILIVMMLLLEAKNVSGQGGQSQTGQKQLLNESNRGLVDSMLMNLNKCYEYGLKCLESNGSSLTSVRQLGNGYYNAAFNQFVRLQGSDGFDLPKNKTTVISETLGFYAEIFNGRYAMSHDFKEELEFLNANLKDWPNATSTIEKDFDENIVRVILGKNSKSSLTLPSNGDWCLWEIQNGERIWLEGYVPRYGHNKIDVNGKHLPLFLGEGRDYDLTNASPGKAVHLIFRQCRKQ